jgi:hypothetical protein
LHRQVIRRQPRDIARSALAHMAEPAPFYPYTASIFTYGATRDLLLTAVLAAAVRELFAIPAFGALPDRIGRRRMYLIGPITAGIFGFVFFTMVDTKSASWILLAIVLSLVPHAMMYEPDDPNLSVSAPSDCRSGSNIQKLACNEGRAGMSALQSRTGHQHRSCRHCAEQRTMENCRSGRGGRSFTARSEHWES